MKYFYILVLLVSRIIESNFNLFPHIWNRGRGIPPHFLPL
jgi:hypothetical protein